MKKNVFSTILFLSILLTGQKAFAYDFEVNGIGYTVTSFENNTVSVDGLNETISGIIDIPSNITYNNKSFSVTAIKSCNSTKIKSVRIPSSISKIDDGAFIGSSIKSIIIPDNVNYIGKSAFEDCKELIFVRMSQNVTSLNEYLFYGCTKLVEIDWHPVIDGYIGGIRRGVFYDCTSLKTFRLPAGIVLSGSNYEGHHYTVFNNCTSLDSLIIEDGDGIIELNYYYDGSTHHGEFSGSKINYVYLGRAFEDKSKYDNHTPILRYVEHLEIGDKVTELPTWLPNQQNYGDAKHLKTLIIGSSLTKVADFSNSYNFDGTYGNQSLEYIKIKRVTPPEAEGFSNYNFINTILYVPKGAKAAYQSAEIWKNFWNIQEYSDEGTDVDTQKCANPTINYSNGKLSFSCQTDGATCQSTIADTDIKSYSVNEIELGVTYVVSVYATKPGYENSDVVTATLCWLNAEPKTEGMSNDIAEAQGNAILIQSHDGIISIAGVAADTNIAIYSVSGQMVGSTIAHDHYSTISTSLKKGEVAIIRIGNKSLKYMTQ